MKQATYIYNEKIAKRFWRMDYYKSQADNAKDYEYIEKEKSRLSTKNWEYITELIEEFTRIKGHNNIRKLGETMAPELTKYALEKKKYPQEDLRGDLTNRINSSLLAKNEQPLTAKEEICASTYTHFSFAKRKINMDDQSR